MKIIEYNDNYQNDWDSFVENNSINGTIYHTRNFLNYHNDKFIDTSIIIYSDLNEILCVVPCCLFDGINFSHKGATYGGPVLSKKKLHVNEIEDIVNKIFLYYDNNFECRLANDIYFEEPINLLYYLLSKKLEIYLELSWYVKSGTNLIENITNKRNKQNLLKMIDNNNYQLYSSNNTEDYINYYSILELNLLENHKSKPTHTLEEFLLIKNILNNKQELFIVKKIDENVIIGGVYVIKVTNNCWYTFYITRNINIKNSGISIIYLMNYISDIAKNNGVKYLDYGISTENLGKEINMGLSEFKNDSLGGLSNYRYVMKNNNVYIWKKIFKNIYYYNNNAAIRHFNNINLKLFNANNKVDIKICNNVLFKFKDNCDLTDYNIEHLFNNFTNNDIENLCPNINTYNNFLNSISNKQIENNSLFCENAVFFNSFTCFHKYITHVFFDYIHHINIYYNLLKKNPEFKIILEFIPHGCFSLNHEYNDTYINTDVIKIFKKFLKDIDINNEVIIVSNYKFYKNITEDNIFVKKLYVIDFNKNKYHTNWLPLLSRVITNTENNNFSNTLIDIINKKNEINIHYSYYGCKFFILEKRINSSFDSNLRNINLELFEKIKKICEEYCFNNKLKLVIWDDELIKRESIYEQFRICNNAEIIIGFGGSFWLFNYTINTGKILLLGLLTEYNEVYKMLYNITFYTFAQEFYNRNIENIYIHFYDKNDIFTYDKIIYEFLYNNKISLI